MITFILIIAVINLFLVRIFQNDIYLHSLGFISLGIVVLLMFVFSAPDGTWRWHDYIKYKLIKKKELPTRTNLRTFYIFVTLISIILLLISFSNTIRDLPYIMKLKNANYSEGILVDYYKNGGKFPINDYGYEVEIYSYGEYIVLNCDGNYGEIKIGTTVSIVYFPNSKICKIID